MKKVLFILGLVGVFFVFSSNRNGRINRSGQAATTAPGENQSFCGSVGCHFGSNFNADLAVSVSTLTGDKVDQYVPGQDYSVSIKINHTGTPAGYGFQIVSLKDSDDSSIDNFYDIPDYAQVVTFMSRQYIEQKSTTPIDSLSFNWTAPEAGTGDVTFYAAGNAVDGTGGSNNDSGDTTRFTFKEDRSSSLNDFQIENSLTISPNPVNDFVSVITEDVISEMKLLSLQGQLVKSFDTTENVDLSFLNNGVYILVVQNSKGQTQSKKLIKL